MVLNGIFYFIFFSPYHSDINQNLELCWLLKWAKPAQLSARHVFFFHVLFLTVASQRTTNLSKAIWFEIWDSAKKKKKHTSVFFPIIIVSGLIVVSTWVSTAPYSTRLLKWHQGTRMLRWGFALCVIKRVHEEFRDSSELGLDHTLCVWGGDRKYKLSQGDIIKRAPNNCTLSWTTPPRVNTAVWSCSAPV